MHINSAIYGNICIRVEGYETDIGIGIRERDTKGESIWNKGTLLKIKR